MKTLRVGVAPFEEMKARSLAIARGEIKPLPDDPKVWFTSTESFAKVLSASNRALLAASANVPALVVVNSPDVAIEPTSLPWHGCRARKRKRDCWGLKIRRALG